MAHLIELRERKMRILAILLIYLEMLDCFTLITIIICHLTLTKRLKNRKRKWDCYKRSLVREVQFDRIVFMSDLACIENTRMDRAMERELNQTVPEVEAELNFGEDENFCESQTTQATRSSDQSRGGGFMPKTGKRGGKRPRYNDDVSDSIVASLNKLGTFHERASDNIEKLTTCFIQDRNTVDRSNVVTSTLKEIDGLSVMDMVKAAILINNNNKLCESFLTMDTPEMRKGFVYLVLTNNGAI